jgi:hypothetical protein
VTWGFLLLVLLLGRCVARAEPSDLVRARPFEPSKEHSGPFEVGRLRFEAGFVLTSSDAGFGGLSGLAITADGSLLRAVSDEGRLWTAALQHDADGRLRGLVDWQVIDLAALGNSPKEAGGDAEALASDGAGGLVIAYEGAHRLRRIDLDDLSAPPVALPMPSGLAPSNEGIEGLTALPDGGVLALTEGIRDGAGDLAAWRIGPDRIDRLGYVPVDGFVPTGADRLDDRIFVVERRFSLLGGFASRVAVLPVDALASGARLRGEELGRLGPTTISENFEGIAVRRAPDGRTLLYLVSDDNFLALQQTLLLQFSLIEP